MRTEGQLPAALLCARCWHMQHPSLFIQLEQLQQTACRLPHGELSSRTEQFVSPNAKSELLNILSSTVFLFDGAVRYNLFNGWQQASEGRTGMHWRQCVINVEVLSNLLNMQPTYW